MSLHEYRRSLDLAGRNYPFYALIMAAVRQADTRNAEKLRAAFPEVYEEFKARYGAPRGLLPGEKR